MPGDYQRSNNNIFLISLVQTEHKCNNNSKQLPFENVRLQQDISPNNIYLISVRINQLFILSLTLNCILFYMNSLGSMKKKYHEPMNIETFNRYLCLYG